MVSKILNTLKPEIRSQVIHYLDDILIHSQDKERHAQVLAAVFEAFEIHGILLKPDKSKLFQSNIDYLGFNIGHEGIKVKSTYTDKIRKWPAPNNLKTLEAFLGFCGFYSSLLLKFPERSFNMLELRKNLRKNKTVFYGQKSAITNFMI